MAEAASPSIVPSPTALTESATIPPSLALELRLRQLESSIGSSSSPTTSSSSNSKPLLLRALAAQKQIEASTSSHNALRRFIKEYDANSRILDPGFRVTRGSGSDGATEGESSSNQSHPDGQTHAQVGREVLSVADQLVLVQDAEVELRAMERLLLECQALDQRGVAGSGNLAGEHEPGETRRTVCPWRLSNHYLLSTALGRNSIRTIARASVESVGCPSGRGSSSTCAIGGQTVHCPAVLPDECELRMYGR